MATLRISACHSFCALQFFLLIQTKVFCYQYKVGDLDAWNIPTPENPNAYIKWSKNHSFKIGDSLLFLYPPSQDSVLRVKKESYDSCNLKDPILEMKDGNSIFNITTPGEFYFTSGVKGHCEKSQKLHISLPGNGSYASSSYGPSAVPAASPSYPTVFGAIPIQASSSTLTQIPVFMCAAIGFFVFAVAIGIGRN